MLWRRSRENIETETVSTLFGDGFFFAQFNRLTGRYLHERFLDEEAIRLKVKTIELLADPPNRKTVDLGKEESDCSMGEEKVMGKF